MKNGFLYRLTFPNGKAYIGITTRTVAARFYGHVQFSRIGKKPCAVHMAIRKYGADAVNVETLAVGKWGYLTELESKAISAFNSKAPFGYNLTDGGEGAIGVVRSVETRGKISAANKGNTLSRQNVEMLKAINTGRVKSAYECARISAGLKGKPKSASHIEKMRLASTGKTLSVSAREKVSAFNKGKTFSAETRAKISASCTARWAARKADKLAQGVTP